MRKNFLLVIKSFGVGLVFYMITLKLLTLVINTGDIVGLSNGIIFSSLIFFILFKNREN